MVTAPARVGSSTLSCSSYVAMKTSTAGSSPKAVSGGVGGSTGFHATATAEANWTTPRTSATRRTMATARPHPPASGKVNSTRQIKYTIDEPRARVITVRRAKPVLVRVRAARMRIASTTTIDSAAGHGHHHASLTLGPRTVHRCSFRACPIGQMTRTINHCDCVSVLGRVRPAERGGEKVSSIRDCGPRIA